MSKEGRVEKYVKGKNEVRDARAAGRKKYMLETCPSGTLPRPQLIREQRNQEFYLLECFSVRYQHCLDSNIFRYFLASSFIH